MLRINYAYLWVSSPSASFSACPACSLLLLLSVLGEALISSGISTLPLGSGGEGRHFYGVSNCQQNVAANEGGGKGKGCNDMKGEEQKQLSSEL